MFCIITFSYVDSSSIVFSVCVSTSYVFFFFFRSAYQRLFYFNFRFDLINKGFGWLKRGNVVGRNNDRCVF